MTEVVTRIWRGEGEVSLSWSWSWSWGLGERSAGEGGKAKGGNEYRRERWRR